MATTENKTAQEILNNVNSNKELQENFKKIYSFDSEDFIRHAERYIKACRENRIFCVIRSANKGGMTWALSFNEASFYSDGKGRFLDFFALFIVLGYSERNENDEFTVNGFGKDIVFRTHYNIIRTLYNLGMMTKEECEILEKNTPVKY